MLQKTFSFWISLNSIIWFVSFVFIIFLMLINFSSATANIPPGGLEKLNKMFFDIYLPFLGIVTGSLFTLSKSKQRVLRNQYYPVFVTAMILFFNGFMIVAAIIFVANPTYYVQNFLDLIQSFNRYVAFFLAGLMTHFNLFF